MTDIFEEVLKKSNDHSYMSGVEREQHRVKMTGEVFTPTEEAIDIMKDQLKINDNCYSPEKTILDLSCGDGQLLVPIKFYRMLRYNVSEQEASSTIYGVDIMRDNVELCKKRLGGGNIVLGDTLNPLKRLKGQTDEEHTLIKKLFANKDSVFIDEW